MFAEAEEQKRFEDKLDRALAEASQKVGRVLDLIKSPSNQLEMSVRLAAEAVEYSSALFSLTYRLEDVYPQVKIDKKSDPKVLVKGSVESLNKAMELRQTSVIDAYANLRQSADSLARAYLNLSKKTRKKIS